MARPGKNLFRFRQFSHAVDSLDPFLNTQVSCRHYIGTAEVEDQEHLCGPGTDPAYQAEVFDHLLIV